MWTVETRDAVLRGLETPPVRLTATQSTTPPSTPHRYVNTSPLRLSPLFRPIDTDISVSLHWTQTETSPTFRVLFAPFSVFILSFPLAKFFFRFLPSYEAAGAWRSVVRRAPPVSLLLLLLPHGRSMVCHRNVQSVLHSYRGK